MKYNLTYTEAIPLLLSAVASVGTECIPLQAAYSRILGEPLLAAANVPAFDRSPLDGYAVRSEDTVSASQENSVTLTILEEIPAGGVPHCPITPGTAVKILTGAPIPPGADAVIMFEETEFTPEQVTLFRPLKPDSNIVHAGDDVKIGAVLADPGQRIDAGLMGTLSGQNRTAVTVFRKPRVGLISTGSELTAPGSPLAPGKIYDTNQYTLAGALQSLGCEPMLYGIAGDSVEAISQALRTALAVCDAVMLTGGVSVGDYDLTPAAMERCGAELLFRRCRMKPGMACAFGVCEGKLICGLSGNPASAMTTFNVIVRPALRKLCGQKNCIPEEIPVTLMNAVTKASPSTRVLRGALNLSDGTVRLDADHAQGNVVLSSVIGNQIMVIVPAGSPPLPAGARLKGIII